MSAKKFGKNIETFHFFANISKNSLKSRTFTSNTQIAGRAGQCQLNYICLPSLNQPQIALCCSRLTNQPLICPDRQVLFRVSTLTTFTQSKKFQENGQPKICGRNQINPCPAGYTCRPSVSAPTISICCSDSTTATCPGGFTPQPDITGNPVSSLNVFTNTCFSCTAPIWIPIAVPEEVSVWNLRINLEFAFAADQQCRLVSVPEIWMR